MREIESEVTLSLSIRVTTGSITALLERATSPETAVAPPGGLSSDSMFDTVSLK